MNLLLVVDQNLSYRQAVQVAYNKAKMNGGVDEFTERVCQALFSTPEPTTVYHESDMDGVEYTPDGGVNFASWGGAANYEQSKIDGRKGYADWLQESMRRIGEELNVDCMSSATSLNSRAVSFVVDEKGELKAVSLTGQLTPEEERRFSRLLNERQDLKTLAVEYARVMLSLLSCTKAGPNAGYAQLFKPS
ncbi:hypothetical protein [Pseudomonas sp. NA-150]|uniref:hypothetical protein n=1 Tax=Pseudomonas sp. NA-150 TaxID=3367525 RepID=UPI0037CA1C78